MYEPIKTLMVDDASGGSKCHPNAINVDTKVKTVCWCH